MNDRYRLGGLGDDQLLAAVTALVKRENDSLSDLLAHLAELDERQLCVTLGYSSLFAYCMEALGFCRSSAGRRIAAARICRQFPEAFARVANGELQLSVLCALRAHLNAANASELFAACSRKSYEQVEVLLAARFPKPDVRDAIRRLPVPRVRTPHIGSEQKDTARVAIVQQECSLSPAAFIRTTETRATETRATETRATETRATETRATGINPGACLSGTVTALGLPQGDPIRGNGHRAGGAVKPLSADRFSVNFTADGEFRELLDEVRALLSHAEPKGDLLTVMKRGLETLRGELLKKRFGVGPNPRRVQVRKDETRAAPQSLELRASKRTRHVAAAVAREVYERDRGRCTFCADDGRRCSEQRLLQLDHVTPHAEGGEATGANLRLRCRAHNLLTARVHFGREYVRAAAERARERCTR